jgi:glucose 1-dehydrogenase
MDYRACRRIGEPSDIAQAAVWLASDASDCVTGSTTLVDGGMTPYPGIEDGPRAAPRLRT